MISANITVRVGLRPWARLAVRLATWVVGLALRVIEFAVDHGVEVK